MTDPVILEKVLNSGEPFYRIYAQNPNYHALKDIFDRMFGSPTQAMDMTVKGQLEVDLVQRLHRAQARLADVSK